MRWLVLLFLFWTPLQAQSVKDFPIINGVSQVTLVGYTLLFDLSPITPHPDFRIWWAEMEECTGVHGDFDVIKWYQASQVINPLEGMAYWGVYFKDPPEIVLLRGMALERFENTVKHEMLHHLMFGNHNENLFNRCLPLGLEND